MHTRDPLPFVLLQAGVHGLFFRGIGTKLCCNALQVVGYSCILTVLFSALDTQERLRACSPAPPPPAHATHTLANLALSFPCSPFLSLFRARTHSPPMHIHPHAHMHLQSMVFSIMWSRFHSALTASSALNAVTALKAGSAGAGACHSLT